MTTETEPEQLTRCRRCRAYIPERAWTLDKSDHVVLETGPLAVDVTDQDALAFTLTATMRAAVTTCQVVRRETRPRQLVVFAQSESQYRVWCDINGLRRHATHISRGFDAENLSGGAGDVVFLPGWERDGDHKQSGHVLDVCWSVKHLDWVDMTDAYEPPS